MNIDAKILNKNWQTESNSTSKSLSIMIMIKSVSSLGCKVGIHITVNVIYHIVRTIRKIRDYLSRYRKVFS